MIQMKFLQTRNTDADIENKCMDTKGRNGVGGTGKLGLIETYYQYYV